MATVVIGPGETVRVELSEADGAFEITFGERELTVSAELPGSHLGGEGVIYREVWQGCTCGEFAHRAPGRDPRCPEHGEHAPKAVAAGATERT